jgi:UDP-N-acetylmuramyl pentapeptide phosphotransferase/UDP-N-acetylglucosamine-1-phosphate transferase
VTVATLLVVAVVSAVVSSALQPVLRRWAERRRIVAVPNARSSHTRDTPVGGGLPIAVSALVVAVSAEAWLPGTEPWAWSFAAGLALIAAVSWYDDLAGANTLVRLCVQGAAAALVVVPMLGTPGAPAGALLALTAVVWIVGVANAYNFMDGIDGIAGGQAVVAGLAWMWLGAEAGFPLAAAIGAALAGASLGFLPFNWSPARIFMGDVGAVPIGFSFAVLTVGVASAGGAADAAAGTACLWPFLFDAAFTLARRIVRRENILQAHRSHLYQRLVRAGCSHGAVARAYIGLAALGLPVAALIRSGTYGAWVAAGAVVAAAATGLVVATWRRERRAPQPQRISARPT